MFALLSFSSDPHPQDDSLVVKEYFDNFVQRPHRDFVRELSQQLRAEFYTLEIVLN